MDETFLWSQLVSNFGQFWTPGCHGWFGIPKVTSPVPFPCLGSRDSHLDFRQARISENPSMCITTLSAKNLKDQIEFTMGVSTERWGVLSRAYVMDAEQQSATATCSLMFFSDIYIIYDMIWYDMIWYDMILLRMQIGVYYYTAFFFLQRTIQDSR